jgi:hypothetical protein
MGLDIDIVVKGDMGDLIAYPHMPPGCKHGFM